MAKRYLSLPGSVTMCLDAPVAAIANPQHLGAHLPGFNGLRLSSSDNADIDVICKRSNHVGLEHNIHQITLRHPEIESMQGDLPHLLFGVMRREWLYRGFYPVHAACVVLNGRAILLVGHSGAGKTTLAHRLVEQHGCKLFSGNKTLVELCPEGAMAIAGTRVMTALNSDQQRYGYQMNPDQYAPAEPLPIASVALVRVNDGVEEAQRLTPLSAMHTLYPFFMDTVNADVIVNGTQVLDCSVDKSVKDRLVVNLGEMLATLPVYKISGPMNYLEQKVMTL